MGNKPRGKRVMKCKTALIWSFVNGRHHKSLLKEERQILGSMPLVEKLFPGINYYSISGFHQVAEKCVIPVLKKRFPGLMNASEEEIMSKATTEIAEFLPSDGYEWQDSKKWKFKFNKLLAVK